MTEREEGWEYRVKREAMELADKVREQIARAEALLGILEGAS